GPQQPRPVMRGARGLDRDYRRSKPLQEHYHVVATYLPAKNWLFSRVHPVELENVLRRVHTNSDNVVHGWPPSLRSATTSAWHIDAVGAVHPNIGRSGVGGTAAAFVRSRARISAPSAAPSHRKPPGRARREVPQRRGSSV